MGGFFQAVFRCEADCQSASPPFSLSLSILIFLSYPLALSLSLFFPVCVCGCEYRWLYLLIFPIYEKDIVLKKFIHKNVGKGIFIGGWHEYIWLILYLVHLSLNYVYRSGKKPLERHAREEKDKKANKYIV